MIQAFCSQCGANLPENANVCPQCGKPVNNQAAQTQPPQPQQPQPIPQYQQSPYYQRPAVSSGGENKGLLYAIIALLVALLIGGAAYYFISHINEKEAAQAEQMEQLKKQQDELATQNKELTEKNEQLAEENAKKQDVKVIVQKPAVHSAEHRAVSAGGGSAKVVINGVGVRLRFAPSLSAGYLTWENGQTRAPKKGARLQYTGEDGDWYQVKYLGHTFYVSKEFSYLEY